MSAEALAGALARMQQHVLDDGISSLAVLNDLLDVLFEKTGQFIGADFLGEAVCT
jgi:hypothetical protein